MLVILRQSNAASGATEAQTLRRGSRSSVRDCEHRHNSADHNRGGARSLGSHKRVAVFVVRLHGYSGHGEVGAVYSNHGGLSQARLGVVFLDSWVDGDSRSDDPKDEVYRNRCLIHSAATRREEDVLDDSHRERCKIHAESRADEDEAPDLGVGVSDLCEAVFGPRMGEVDEQDKTQDKEHHRADE